MSEVLIIGAGVAGLAAAEVLAEQGLNLTLLEARDRIGGRILTVPSVSGDFPVELGAEFIHGAKNGLWPIVQQSEIRVDEVPGRHWVLSHGALRERPKFYDAIEKVFAQIQKEPPDLSFAEFLRNNQRRKPSEKVLALEYVEGFHAADPAQVSTHSIADAETAAQNDEGDRQFRIACGYQTVLDRFQRRLSRSNVEWRFQTEVKSVRWEPRSVEVNALTPHGLRTFTAPQALITLPIGVLRDDEENRIVLEPALKAKTRAVAGLEMGCVVKLILEFRSPFWPVRNFGFIHAVGQRFPTWWSDERGPILTAWAGGPQARALGNASSEEVEEEALKAVAKMFKQDYAKVKELLVRCHCHDWSGDPFARGAYSYIRVGMTGMPARLAEPVKDTLFFAGEATAEPGEQGTVHGAIASGQRAAKEITAIPCPSYR
jgi:monoamine oxidase